MGFPEEFKLPIADTRAYRVLAESVAVPLVTEIAEKMKKAIEKKTPAGLTKWTTKKS